MYKNVLIIGGGGFIGINLTYFLEKYYTIYIVNRPNDKLDQLISNHPNVKLLNTNITNISISELTELNFESIIWLAHNSVPASNSDIINDIQIDIYPLINFINKLILANYKYKFIYFSSGGTIYGNTYEYVPFKETDYCNPISKYGYIKLFAENTIKYLFLNTEISVFIVRPSNVYGFFQNLNKPQGLIGHVFQSLLTDKNLDIYDDGKIIRDYIHVSDISNFILKLLSYNSTEKYQIFNVGSSKSTSIQTLLNLVEKITFKKIKIISKEPRYFDCNYNVLDTTKTKTTLNWIPKLDLEEGLVDYWNKLNNNYNE
jgi:UDP-glucose 4-epimerase